MYVVVDSERGLEVVPDNWLFNNDRYYQYPSGKSKSTINKAVKNKSKPDDDWHSSEINRIFGRYGKNVYL